MQGDEVRSLSRQQSNFDPGMRSNRSIFSTPSAQDEFLKKQRDERKKQRATASKQTKQPKNDVATNDTTTTMAASPLFQKKALPPTGGDDVNSPNTTNAAAATDAPRSVLQQQGSEQESVGHGSVSWNEHTTNGTKETTSGSQTVSNALSNSKHSAQAPAGAKPVPAKKGRKQILFFMPDS